MKAINLTQESITLLADSGPDRVTFEASGYVAHVETTRANVCWIDMGVIIHSVEVHPLCIILHDIGPEGNRMRLVPMEQFDTNRGHCVAVGSDIWILVSQEVAEAAAFLKHPLAAQMVWTDVPAYEGAASITMGRPTAYRSVRRVPGTVRKPETNKGVLVK